MILRSCESGKGNIRSIDPDYGQLSRMPAVVIAYFAPCRISTPVPVVVQRQLEVPAMPRESQGSRASDE